MSLNENYVTQIAEMLFDLLHPLRCGLDKHDKCLHKDLAESYIALAESIAYVDGELSAIVIVNKLSSFHEPEEERDDPRSLA